MKKVSKASLILALVIVVKYRNFNVKCVVNTYGYFTCKPCKVLFNAGS